MKGYIYIYNYGYGQWDEFEMYKAGTLTFYALYFCVVGIFFFFKTYHVLFCAI